MLRVADGIGGIEAGDLRLGWCLRQGFLELRLFRAGILVGFRSLSVELLGGKLQKIVSRLSISLRIRSQLGARGATRVAGTLGIVMVPDLEIK